MDVFIGILPAAGRRIELVELLDGKPLQHPYERRSGRDCFERHYHYFVVFTDSEDQGWTLIEQLNGKSFEGCRISAREFIRRAERGPQVSEWERRERRVNSAASE